jgi:hypothetical protein
VAAVGVTVAAEAAPAVPAAVVAGRAVVVEAAVPTAAVEAITAKS